MAMRTQIGNRRVVLSMASDQRFRSLSEVDIDAGQRIDVSLMGAGWSQVAPFKATCGNPELGALENTTCHYYTVGAQANSKPLAFRYKTLGLADIDPI